ncbi:hypothetical protein Taro_050459, partial [Colocasia esculenta]|nr:hypothetical protein [Colocasia esculenta]
LGDTAIATILFVREWNFLHQRLSLLSFLMTLIRSVLSHYFRSFSYIQHAPSLR